MMCRNVDGGIRYAALYVHQVYPDAPGGCYKDLTSIRERLRWLRKSRGLLQSEVAKQVGVTRAVYMDLEGGETQHIPAAVADKLAALYGVPVSHLMDAYDNFIYMGQALQIRKIRNRLSMNKKQFARYLGIPISNLRAWESGKKTISRKCWEKYFRDR